jgi:hypothetical protein
MGLDESPPASLPAGYAHVKVIDGLSALAKRLWNTLADEKTEFLFQQASMAFVKTTMSLDAYLSFVPYSSAYANRAAQIFDISSISVMARQVMEDVLSFLYLSEANLSVEQKKFRGMVWTYHGCCEWLEAQTFRDPSHPDIPKTRTMCDQARQNLEQNPLLDTIESGWRGRIRKGQMGHVLHDDEILERRGIRTNHFRAFLELFVCDDERTKQNRIAVLHLHPVCESFHGRAHRSVSRDFSENETAHR